MKVNSNTIKDKNEKTKCWQLRLRLSIRLNDDDGCLRSFMMEQKRIAVYRRDIMTITGSAPKFAWLLLVA